MSSCSLAWNVKAALSNQPTHDLHHSDLEYFAPLVDASAAPNAKALGENWILRFNHLKKVYRLVVRYFE